jgi:hypothetical protein
MLSKFHIIYIGDAKQCTDVLVKHIQKRNKKIKLMLER